MRKILIAASIAAAAVIPAAAMADTTLYGNFRWTVGQFDNGTTDTISSVNNASRLGVKGSIGEKGGLTGFYHMQMGASNDGDGTTGLAGADEALSDRFYFAGVKGGFGTLLLGRASSPYKMGGVKIDPFYDTIAGSGNGGSDYGFSSLTNGFLNNVVAYITPKIAGGLTINAVAVIDDGTDDEHAFNVGAAWSASGITVGVQALAAEDTPNVGVDAVRLHAGYKNKAFSVGLNYEELDTGTIDGEFLNLNGTFSVGSAGKIAASFGQVDGDLTGGRNAAGDGFTVGYFHKVAKSTEVRAIYTDLEYDAGGERSAFGLMLIQSF